MPITAEGNFLAYKGVNHDFTDKHTGKLDNSAGQTLSMDCNKVCDDTSVDYSTGFCSGSYEYAKGYASDGDHLMITEINPADVVGVKQDCECREVLASKYKVIGLMEPVGTAPLQDDCHDDNDGEPRVNEYHEGWYAGYKQGKEDAAECLIETLGKAGLLEPLGVTKDKYDDVE